MFNKEDLLSTIRAGLAGVSHIKDVEWREDLHSDIVTVTTNTGLMFNIQVLEVLSPDMPQKVYAICTDDLEINSDTVAFVGLNRQTNDYDTVYGNRLAYRDGNIIIDDEDTAKYFTVCTNTDLGAILAEKEQIQRECEEELYLVELKWNAETKHYEISNIIGDTDD